MSSYTLGAEYTDKGGKILDTTNVETLGCDHGVVYKTLAAAQAAAVLAQLELDACDGYEGVRVTVEES